MPDTTFPPTPAPETGQGPWCDGLGKWWVVADSPVDALREIEGMDDFPCYFGWQIVMERTCIRWVPADEWDEEHEIIECNSEYEDHAEAWRISLENR